MLILVTNVIFFGFVLFVLEMYMWKRLAFALALAFWLKKD